MLIAGLDADNTRTLTVNYYAETDDTVMQVVGPFLGFFIFGGVAGLIIWTMWKK